MRFRVEYKSAAELLDANEQEFSKGGLLVRGEPPAGVSLFDAAELEIVTPRGAAVTLAAQVVQIVPGVGVALVFTMDDSLAAELQAASRAPAPAPAAKAPSITDKIHKALHGNRDERSEILRDINKTLHPYVLKNPNLQLDEIQAIAKNTQVSPELLKGIFDRPEWSRRPEIALALIRNPKFPVPQALRLLDFVSPADLRQLAKDSRTREPIQRAARKKVVNPGT
jgi:hypothetical protein